MDRCWRSAPDGALVRVRVTPKSATNRIDGIRKLPDGTSVLIVRVTAAPDKGAANKAVEKLIAGIFGVAPAKVNVASGHKARRKTVHVAGDPVELETALQALEDRDDGGGN